ncbi:MAG: acyltransferase [Fuerstiella sp.]|nr:acyltransferase [Fuerstiella sp.]MCP4510351.1 acyltransferase [Fuerstiella sp.]
MLGIGGNRDVYWPVSRCSQVYDAANIYAGVDTCPGMMKGCYIQGRGGIWFGDYTQIAPNVVIVSANHDPHDLRQHIPSPVRIGDYCWIGANASVMPGVTLGDFTVVGAGSVITKSFPDGYCVVAGNPARRIRDLDRAKCVTHECKVKYNGYIRSDRFAEYKREHLRIDDIFDDEA